MAQVTRIKVTQPDGETKEPVAFLSDIKLKTVEAGDLITVTTDNKTATVSVDSNILSIENGNVKVNKPLEFAVQTTTPTETTGLRAVNIGGTTKLYWGNNVIEAHNPEEGYVTTADFNAHAGNEADNVKHVTKNQLDALSGIQAGETVITDTTLETALTPIETAIETLQGVTGGYTTENTIKDAVDEVDAKVDAVDVKADSILNGVIGAWSTIRDTTVKAAIEDAEEAIEINAAEIAALKGNHFIVVAELPATGEPNCIYLIPKDGTEERNIKEEWIYVNNAWEKIGDTAVDLTEYAKTTEVQELVTAETTRATGVEGTLTDLTTDAKGNLVAAINEVDANADSALGIANTAVQTAEGDDYISASVSDTKLTVAVIADTELAKILSVCTITTEEE